ncbi:MAG: hypothetical protein KME55_14825 [Nostoc indistinguendum CM1-VF10]|nr:hypothetical protein [Nostoc indistinguendum CM1-VF10]
MLSDYLLLYPKSVPLGGSKLRQASRRDGIFFIWKSLIGDRYKSISIQQQLAFGH